MLYQFLTRKSVGHCWPPLSGPINQRRCNLNKTEENQLTQKLNKGSEQPVRNANVPKDRLRRADNFTRGPQARYTDMNSDDK